MDEYWILTGIVFAATVADVELTQHCLARGTCHEGNPLVPTGRGKMYAVQLPITAAVSYLGWQLRRGKARYWWVPQVGVTTAHGVGVGFGLRFVW